MDDYTPIISEEERLARRAQRAEVRRKRQRARRRQMLIRLLPAAALCLVLVTTLVLWLQRKKTEPEPEMAKEIPAAAAQVQANAAAQPAAPYSPVETAQTRRLGDEISSSYAVLIDLQSNTILAEKSSKTVINPASMTKILTLLVAAEHLNSLDDTFTITREITDYCYVNDCSVVGLDVGETVTVRELLYGTILSSGADAALGLAEAVAGSHEAFVELMNAKLAELGLAETAHFTNCVGLYDESHVCTVYDMAMILKAAMDNELCRQVLSAHTYETTPTPQHPEGQVLSNWFLRKIEDHDKEQAVRAVGAKTGYVVQSGSCAASWGEDAAGNAYLCVTGDAGSSWQAIFDHAALYQLCGQTDGGGSGDGNALPAA